LSSPLLVLQVEVAEGQVKSLLREQDAPPPMPFHFCIFINRAGEEHMSEGTWVKACRVDEVEPADVIRFDYAGRTFAICRTEDGAWHAIDGLCTHGKAHLAEGLVIDGQIECPKHNGRFDLCTGAAKRTPARVALRTYPVRVEGADVLVCLE
jgi:3-phenylpropionate/trans-cinnamate dioxygenase ferredoxin subunit